jgi:DMSO/TMAO reductase YedYZ molybdopterin-dependent catalytic subunit
VAVISRRGFLVAAAGGALYSQDGGKRGVIVRSARPEDLEMELSGFSSYITPVERFFVRTHVYEPSVNAREWRLKVEGEVNQPLELTLEDVRKLPPVEVVSVLECAGNGRAYFDPPMPGIQWSDGAVGNARWRGVRLAAVLRRAGLKPSAAEILLDGADIPIGTMPDFQRSIPVKKAIDPNTLLAYEMNGEPLPPKHGFPLRAVVPGWAGDSWMKWVTGIRVLNREHDGFWMKTAYRFPNSRVAAGAAVPPEATHPVTSLRVKSVIASPVPIEVVAVGRPVTIRGAAWGGEDGGPVVSVHVSTDNGRSWRPARLTSAATQFGWRLWEFPWTPPREDRYTILAQARDRSGDSQPWREEWNPSGYLWNTVSRREIIAARAGQSRGPLDAQEPPPPPLFRGSCLPCHDIDIVRQQRLTREQWNREIDKMTGWGAQVRAEDRGALLDWLASSFGPERR